MTPSNPDTTSLAAEEITLDEIKQRAGAVRDLAVSEAKRVTVEVYEQDVTKIALVAVGVVVVVASLAYFMGAASARRGTGFVD
jgi:hypothetical protein